MENISVTSRQLEVLEYVCNGYTNKEIAKILCIELSTVKFHVAELLRKYQVRNRTYLTRIVTSKQILDKIEKS